MDQHRFVESQYRIQHRHEDGSWGDMVEQPEHLDPAAHDTERAWNFRRIFRCTSCPRPSRWSRAPRATRSPSRAEGGGRRQGARHDRCPGAGCAGDRQLTAERGEPVGQAA